MRSWSWLLPSPGWAPCFFRRKGLIVAAAQRPTDEGTRPWEPPLQFFRLNGGCLNGMSWDKEVSRWPGRVRHVGSHPFTSHRTHTVEGGEMPLPSLVYCPGFGASRKLLESVQSSHTAWAWGLVILGGQGNLLEKVSPRPVPLVTNDPLPGYYV